VTPTRSPLPLRRPPLRIWRGMAVSLLLVLAASSSRADLSLGDTLRAELTLRAALRTGDRDALQTLYADPQGAGAVRGQALRALGSGADAHSAAARARLLEALRDPAAPVRAAAAQLVGETRQRPLEREVLRLVAEDPDPYTRVAALRAVRPWTRQGHLYFLEEALNAPWPPVQAETLENLAALSYRELPPEVIGRVEVLAGPDAPPGVRRQALGALHRWGRLAWPQLQAVVADSAAPDALRLYALELGGTLGTAEGREQLLRDLLDTGASLPLAWAAFRELTTGPQTTQAAVEPVRRFLENTAEHNTATEAMAAYLSRAGNRVEYRSGVWQIGNR